MIATVVTPLGLLLLVLPAPAAVLVAGAIKLLVGCLLAIVTAVLTLPAATLRVPSLPVCLWLLYGTILAGFVAGVWKRSFAVSLAGGLGLLILQGMMLFGDRTPVPPNDVTLNFLDVGQGDSTLIEFPDGRNVLVDGGGTAAGRFLNLRDETTFSIGEDVVSPYLFSKGIRRLDAVVLTHAHHDHMDGLFDVIENFEVREFWLGRNPMIPRYRLLIERLQEKQIPIRWLTSGQTIQEFEVLHPPPSWRVRNTAQNNDSLVLLLNAPHGRVLLTGDVERHVDVPKPVDVLKIPHHGSRGVRLRVTAPIRVISVGANNPFGHPHPSSLPALRTDQDGAITIAMEPEGPRVATMLTKSCLSCTLAFLLTGH
jgi:competence protein ComEC